MNAVGSREKRLNEICLGPLSGVYQSGSLYRNTNRSLSTYIPPYQRVIQKSINDRTNKYHKPLINKPTEDEGVSGLPIQCPRTPVSA